MNVKNPVVFFTISIFFLLLFSACTPKKREGESIAVFIPGQRAGSAIYSLLAEGAERAVREQRGAEIIVVEAGYNQTEWEQQLTMLAASGKHSLIVSSNPSMPYFVSAISEKFPAQRFLLLDAELAGNPNVYTLRYNQREQAYMAGFLAALLSENTRSIGLLAAQEYPVMNNVIKPAYLEGANAAAEEAGAAAPFALDFRFIGNWFDAQKAAELANSMIHDGVKVILTIAGSANEGAVRAAQEGGAHILWFDSNGYAVRPGVIAGSFALAQDHAVYDKLKLYFAGALPFGTAETAGVRDGYVRFIDDDPIYIETVPPEIRERQKRMVERIKTGELALD
ncbi:MAG: BMP family ABC transporter substrate-binding protein [Spirochaetaceae bacterium]|jgi:simple sugar transport system substrate-binding protein|nr:BMP family ABC transporter substrate-binding protein [Spirochaetaceae bacterium]